MKSTTRFFHIFAAAVAIFCAAFATSCIEDEVTTSPAHQPRFSAETIDFGTQFTGENTVTRMLMVYNPHGKVLSISDIRLLEEGGRGVFRINVDGQSGTSFSNVEIRPNDSIYVLVSARLPENGVYDPTPVNDRLRFTTNGVTSHVNLTASGCDILRLDNPVIESDTRWDAATPRRIYGTLRVAPGATLTLEEGTILYFHDKASAEINGTLITEGSAESPVELRGDRLGSVVGDIPFDLMASQWKGLTFTSHSKDSRLAFTEIRNTSEGVTADTTSLSLTNCRLRNSSSRVLTANFSDITAVGCEFAEAGAGAVAAAGGILRMTNCTLSNYYLFSAISGPLLTLRHTSKSDAAEGASSAPFLQAAIENTILYGSSAELNLKDLSGTQITFTRCIFRSNGSDDNNFRNCYWNTDPLFLTDRTNYLFDYRLRPDSPAAGRSATPSLPVPPTDFYGAIRPFPPTVGAYEPIPADSDEQTSYLPIRN